MASPNTDSERLTSFKLSFPDSAIVGGNVVDARKVYPWDLEVEVGQYCLIDGFPCRITRNHKYFTGKYGHSKHGVHGVGLFDNRQHDMIVTTDNYDCHVVVPSRVVEATETDGSLEGSSSTPLVSWVDKDNTPPNNDHFVLTAVVSRAQNGRPRVTIETTWVIETSNKCYKPFLQQREAYKDKQRFTTLLGTTKRQESPSAALGGVEVPGVLKSIFAFVCGQKVLTGDDAKPEAAKKPPAKRVNADPKNKKPCLECGNSKVSCGASTAEQR